MGTSEESSVVPYENETFMERHEGKIPLVYPLDTRINKNRCFYCPALLGKPHKLYCVTLNSRVVYRVKTEELPGGRIAWGTWITFDPYAWFMNGNSDDEKVNELAGHWRFARNEGSWCADNADIVWDDPEVGKVVDKYSEEKGCACGILEFQLANILDEKAIYIERRRGEHL